MVNEINPNHLKTLASIETKKTSGPTDPTNNNSSINKQQPPAAEVSLSEELIQLKAAIEQGQEVDKEKVKAIKTLIEKGEYEANANKIAQKLIDDLD